MKTFYFSATKGKKEDTLLYKTNSMTCDFFFKEDNAQSLPVIYNKAIDFAKEEGCDLLVLCHDDVIIESNIEYKLPKLMQQYDFFGVAGAKECKLQEPALWHIMGGGIGSEKLHGAVAHGNEQYKTMTYFGHYPARAILIDGVLMCITKKVFTEIRFDESNPSNWHFYDLDYSLACHEKRFRIGVSDITITHNSPGLSQVTQEFLRGQKWFLDKWRGRF